jgi:cell division septation protein DedD
MNRSWIGIVLIVLGFTSLVFLDTSCTKKEDEAKPVQFDPLNDGDDVKDEAPEFVENNVKSQTKPATTPVSTHKLEKKTKIVAAAGKPLGWVVQVGSFAQKENAEKLATRLKDHNYKVSVSEKESKKHGKLYLVRLEPTTDLEVAKTQIDKLRAQENLQPVLVAR